MPVSILLGGVIPVLRRLLRISASLPTGYTFGPPQWGQSGTGVLTAASGTFDPPQWGQSGTGVLTATTSALVPLTAAGSWQGHQDVSAGADPREMGRGHRTMRH